MIEGKFIVLEGVDGAGTTTHAERLAETFRGRGLPVLVTQEPSNGPIGGLLRQILRGRVVVPGMRGPRAPSWTTMALLFGADRMDHLEAEILPNLADGVTVISDRYDHSTVAYQSLTGGGETDSLGWVKTINRYVRRPDLTIVLDVPAEVAALRRVQRQRHGEMGDIYDDEELQRRLVEFYMQIEKWFPGEKIVHVGTGGSLEEATSEIERHVRTLRGE